MTQFEFVFTLYSLLLGFSMVELLGGLARLLKLRLGGTDIGEIRIGWLTPLLGIFVMLDLLSFWLAAWIARDMIDVSSLMLLAITLFASFYYLAAHLVFPSDTRNFADLDRHYFNVRKLVFSGLLALAVAQMAFYLSVPDLNELVTRPISILFSLAFALLLLGGMFLKGKPMNIAILGMLIARYAVAYIT